MMMDDDDDDKDEEEEEQQEEDCGEWEGAQEGGIICYISTG